MMTSRRPARISGRACLHQPPKASTGALVVRDDGGAALGRPADGAGALSSHAGPAACPEQE
jgi:hypothetical protein